MKRHDFDMVVIGGGAGGLFAATAATLLGARTCIIEKRRLGGDCTWSGCVPSKALLKSASVVHLVGRAAEFGLRIEGDFVVNSHKVMAHVRRIMHEVSTHETSKIIKEKGTTVVFGRAHFVDEQTIRVRDEAIRFKRCIISTGSRPATPAIEGLGKIDYLTNENVFDLDRLPQDMIVLGGGPVGVELAQALQRLGVRVSLVEMMETILFREDREMAEILEQKLKSEGIEILTGKRAVKLTQSDGRVHAALEDKNKNVHEISAERVLVAVGRTPNTERLGLDECGVATVPGGIMVNTYLETTNKSIFACGDVVGPYLFSHMAAYQAQICVRNALFSRPLREKVNYNNAGWALFTEPELAHVGLTEEETRKKHKNIRVYRTSFSECDRAITEVAREGLVKVIVNRKGFILGAHVVGAGASETIQGFLIAKTLKIPFSKISDVAFIYPTLSELVKTTAAKALLEKLNSWWVKSFLKLVRKI